MRTITFGVVGIGTVVLCGMVAYGQQQRNAERVVHAVAEEGKGFYYTKEQLMKDASDLEATGASRSLTVLDGPHYAVNVVHRRGSEEPQWHREDTDFYVILKGTATMITGGELVGPFDVASDSDKRGTSIRGGVSRTVKPGDIVFIPPLTPHQGVFDSPEGVTYMNLHWPGHFPGPYPPPMQ